jgi:hypothetical protein
MSAVAGSNGLNLASFPCQASATYRLLAGYLIASVPFLARRRQRRDGDLAMRPATSTQPERHRGREASTGNVALNATSLENSA